MRSSGLLFLLLVAACDGEEKADGTGADDTGGGDSAADPEAPVVASVSLSNCEPNTDDIDTWSVAVEVSDRQGDLASLGSTVTVLDSGETLATYAMACYDDRCSASWTETTDGIDCETGESSIFRVVVVDEMGNTSEPYDFQPTAR